MSILSKKGVSTPVGSVVPDIDGQIFFDQSQTPAVAYIAVTEGDANSWIPFGSGGGGGGGSLYQGLLDPNAGTFQEPSSDRTGKYWMASADGTVTFSGGGSEVVKLGDIIFYSQDEANEAFEGAVSIISSTQWLATDSDFEFATPNQAAEINQIASRHVIRSFVVEALATVSSGGGGGGGVPILDGLGSPVGLITSEIKGQVYIDTGSRIAWIYSAGFSSNTFWRAIGGTRFHASADPTGFDPQYDGQIAIRLDTKEVYIGLIGGDNTSWVKISDDQATETVQGSILIADSAEVSAGTDDTKAVTPAKLKSVTNALSSKSVTRLADKVATTYTKADLQGMSTLIVDLATYETAPVQELTFDISSLANDEEVAFDFDVVLKDHEGADTTVTLLAEQFEEFIYDAAITAEAIITNADSLEFKGKNKIVQMRCKVIRLYNENVISTYVTFTMRGVITIPDGIFMES